MNSKPSNPDSKQSEPQLSPTFTRDLIKRTQKRQNVSEVLFMLAVGFRTVLTGFFKIDTVLQNKQSDKQKDN